MKKNKFEEYNKIREKIVETYLSLAEMYSSEEDYQPKSCATKPNAFFERKSRDYEAMKIESWRDVAILGMYIYNDMNVFSLSFKDCASKGWYNEAKHLSMILEMFGRIKKEFDTLEEKQESWVKRAIKKE